MPDAPFEVSIQDRDSAVIAESKRETAF